MFRASFLLFLTMTGSALGQERIKVFIDQDTSGPGGTDAVSIAMLLMAPNIDVVGIGVVGGDAWLDQALYHTLKIVEVSGRPEVPVAAGSEDPLLNSRGAMERREALWGPKEGDGWHGAWGPQVQPKGTIPPAPGGPPTIQPVDQHAAELLVEMARRYPGELVLYTAGPLTNIALAIRLAPDIVDKIKAVYTMGGATYVNHMFNFWWDAEAAAMHLRTPWRAMELTPIDVCHKTQMTRELIERIASAGTPLADYMKESYLGPNVDSGIFTYMWDELAAAAIIDPQVITARDELYLDVQFGWGPNYGKTIWWTPRNRPWWAERPWKVQTDIDRERFENLFAELMRRPVPESP
ncbi:MAG TPA: nucleoside hydrolase [Vicinamibacteria bacterium]|jgi:inosine-uridine nucleoside N-ribohydrolase